MTPAEYHSRMIEDIMLQMMGPLAERRGAHDEACAVQGVILLECLTAGMLTWCAMLLKRDAAQRDQLLIAFENAVRERMSKMPMEGSPCASQK